VSQLKPKQIILHCGLHKTGSTYLQRNLQSNRDKLLDQGILYFGPHSIKKKCPELWKYLQWGKARKKPTKLVRNQIIRASSDLTGDKALENVHTILVSFESIFGTLRAGLTKKDRKSSTNKETRQGLYRYSRRRVRRFMQAFEAGLSTTSLQWTICFATRKSDDFVRSCHVQLIKEGHELANLSHDDFAKISNFSYAEESQLVNELAPLKRNRNVKIIPFSYDQNISHSDPSTYLYNFINLIFPDLSKQIQPILIDNSESNSLAKNSNPGINERGIEIAKEARPIFTKQEWKLFRKFLEKNFIKSN
jgi:hypothetical protein